MALANRGVAGIGFAAFLIVSTFLAAGGSAVAGEYPRRIAVAPFESLTGEDIKSTVAILPRLLSTRLMALAGADVLLLPAGGGSPEEAARQAGFPLLATGTVSRLGKGYSIDVTVVDLATRKPAGVFVASAATEDEIIPQLGVLAGDAVEKLFGVRVARPAPAPAPAAVGAPYAPGAAPQAFPAPAGGGAAYPAAAIAPPPPKPLPKLFTEGRLPTSIERYLTSDKVPDELFRVVIGDIDGDGQPEIVATGLRTVWLFKVKGDAIVPFPPSRIVRGRSAELLNIELFDADGDGKPEIFVTELIQGDRLNSFVLKFQDGRIDEVGSGIGYYLTVLSDVDGKPALAGQGRGFTGIFDRRVSVLDYKIGKVKERKRLGPSFEDGIFGLNAVTVGREGKFVYIDADEHLRLLDGKGKTLSKTKEYYGRGMIRLEFGQATRNEVAPPTSFIRGRILPVGGDPGAPWFVVQQGEGAEIMKHRRDIGASRIVLGRFVDTDFIAKLKSDTSGPLITDLYPLAGGDGTEVIVATALLEGSSNVLNASSSRVGLYRIK